MLIHNGKPVTTIPDSSRVIDNIVFTPGMPNTGRFMKPARGMGLHWTGGERGWEAVAGTLKRKRLSIHFVGETDGTIVQTADLATRCAHIGSPGNARFVGVEFAGRGYATKADLAAARRIDPTLRERDEIDWGTPRDIYSDTIGGRAVHMAGLTPEQCLSGLWLCETLAGILDFPRKIPARKVTRAKFLAEKHPLPDPASWLVTDDNGATWAPSFARSPWARGLASTHDGVLGHFHVHPMRHDPGTQMMYLLWAEGWNPTGAKLFGKIRFEEGDRR